MCFIKSSRSSGSSAAQVPTVVTEAPIEVERKQADASLTKNAMTKAQNRGYKQNVKTSVFGLSDNAITEKNTLLGE